jgi:glucokinase
VRRHPGGGKGARSPRALAAGTSGGASADPADRLAIGVDFGGTRIKLGLVDGAGRVRDRAIRPTPREEGAEAILDALVEGVGDLQRSAGVPYDRILGVGLGTPGPLDLKGERVLFAPNIPGWEGFPLKRRLEERLGRAVALENDANAAALGEYWAGAGREVDSLVFLGLGTGVGGGIVLGGRLWRGAHGAGAELGHVTIVPDGEPCGCGNRGCLETLASARALVREAGRAVDAGRAPRLAALLGEAVPSGGDPRSALNAELVARAALEGDEGALAVYQSIGRWLGIGVAAFMNIFDPDMVVIGGGVAGSAALFLPHVRAEAMRRSFAVISRRVRIEPAELGDDAGVIGAAASFLHRRRTSSEEDLD